MGRQGGDRQQPGRLAIEPVADPRRRQGCAATGPVAAAALDEPTASQQPFGAYWEIRPVTRTLSYLRARVSRSDERGCGIGCPAAKTGPPLQT